MPKYSVDVQPAAVRNPLVIESFRVLAYCWVSTDNEEQIGSLENQVEFYTNYIHKQINWILASIYFDNVSGVR